MVKNYIVYGYYLGLDCFDMFFPQEKFPDFYKDDELLEDDIDLCQMAYSALKKNLPSDIFLYLIDFEFKHTQFSNTGSTIVVGIKIDTMDARYTGVIPIYTEHITEDQKQRLESYIKATNLNLAGIEPSLLSVVSSEL